MRSRATLVVDTNVFLRFFMEDDPEQAERAATLFRRATEGELKLVTFPVVIAEIVWTLESFFGEPRARIRAVVEAICATRNLAVAEQATVLLAIAWYAERRVDFVDAYVAAAAAAAGHPSVASFHRDLGRLPGVTRVEP